MVDCRTLFSSCRPECAVQLRQVSAQKRPGSTPHWLTATLSSQVAILGVRYNSVEFLKLEKLDGLLELKHRPLDKFQLRSARAHQTGQPTSSKTDGCQANMARVTQSGPDSGLGFQIKVLETFQVVLSSLGSGWGVALGRTSGAARGVINNRL